MEYDPDTLIEELDDARSQNRNVIATLPARVRALHGWDFMLNRAVGERDPRNTYYQWVTYFLSLVAAGVPRWKESTSLAEYREDVEAHQTAMNKLSREIRLRGTLARLGVDFAISHAALGVVTCKRYRKADRLLKRAAERGKAAGRDVSGMETDAHYPTLRRLEADQLVWDPTRIEEESWRWTSHLEIRDLSELEAENKDGADWDIDALRVSTYRQGDTSYSGVQLRDPVTHQRDDIVAYWVLHAKAATAQDVRDAGGSAKDEETSEAGYNGALFYLPHNGLTEGGKSRFVRKPQMYKGPDSGPHVVFGSMPVPGTSFRCPPLVANAETIRERADYERAVNLAGRLYKRIVACSRTKEQVAEIIASVAHNGIVAFGAAGEDIRKEVVQLELWGHTPQMIEHLLLLRDTEDQAIGLSEEARGRASDKTATAASLASAATSRRMSLPVSDFVDGVSDAGRKLAHHVWYDERFVIDNGNEIYVGGQSPGDSISFEDVDCEVEYMSIAHMNEDKRALQYQRVMEVTDRLPALPSFAAHTQIDEWAEMVEEYGELPGFERLINHGGLQKATAIFTQGQATAAQPTPEKRPANGGKARQMTVPKPPTFESNARPQPGGAQPTPNGAQNGQVAQL